MTKPSQYPRIHTHPMRHIHHSTIVWLYPVCSKTENEYDGEFLIRSVSSFFMENKLPADVADSAVIDADGSCVETEADKLGADDVCVGTNADVSSADVVCIETEVNVTPALWKEAETALSSGNDVGMEIEADFNSNDICSETEIAVPSGDDIGVDIEADSDADGFFLINEADIVGADATFVVMET